MDSYLRSSVEAQIEEAKRRAYSYAQTTKGARESEAYRNKSLGEERERWARSFEEKSVMIEQLERELQSAVDALEVQRQQSQRSGNSTLIMDDDRINSEFKKLLQSQSPSRKSPARRVQVGVPLESSRSFPQRSFLDTSHAAQHLNQSTNSHVHEHAKSHHESMFMHGGVENGSPLMSTDAWNRLLEQYKEQLQRCRDEVASLQLEKKDLMQRILEATKEMARLVDERDQLKLANTDLEGKLQFRSNQVREYEVERHSLLDVDGVKAQTTERLQTEVQALKYQLQGVEREHKVALHTIASLQQDLRANALDVQRARVREEVEVKEREVTHWKEQCQQIESNYRQELAQTKALVHSLQLRLQHSSQSGLLAASQQQQMNEDANLAVNASVTSLSSRSQEVIRTARSRSRDHTQSFDDEQQILLRHKSSFMNGQGDERGGVRSSGLSRSPSRDTMPDNGDRHRSPSKERSFTRALSPSQQQQAQGNSSSQAQLLKTSGSAGALKRVASTTKHPHQQSQQAITVGNNVSFRLTTGKEEVDDEASSPSKGEQGGARGGGSRSRSNSAASLSDRVRVEEHVDVEDDEDEEEEEGVYEVENADDVFRSFDDADDGGEQQRLRRRTLSNASMSSSKATAGTKKKSTSSGKKVVKKRKSSSSAPVTHSILNVSSQVNTAPSSVVKGKMLQLSTPAKHSSVPVTATPQQHVGTRSAGVLDGGDATMSSPLRSSLKPRSVQVTLPSASPSPPPALHTLPTPPSSHSQRPSSLKKPAHSSQTQPPTSTSAHLSSAHKPHRPVSSTSHAHKPSSRSPQQRVVVSPSTPHQQHHLHHHQTASSALRRSYEDKDLQHHHNNNVNNTSRSFVSLSDDEHDTHNHHQNHDARSHGHGSHVQSRGSSTKKKAMGTTSTTMMKAKHKQKSTPPSSSATAQYGGAGGSHGSGLPRSNSKKDLTTPHLEGHFLLPTSSFIHRQQTAPESTLIDNHTPGTITRTPSFRLPTQSSVTKSAYAENMHLSR